MKASIISSSEARSRTAKRRESRVSKAQKPGAIHTRSTRRFVKPIPYDELRQEIEIVCDLYSRPTVEAALKKFVESTEAMPYLP